MSGHVFIIHGDLTKVACDGRLLPTDATFRIEAPWVHLIGLTGPGHLAGYSWNDGERVQKLDSADHPDGQIWLGNVGTTSSDPGWYASIVGEFCQKAKQSASMLRHKPLLAVNVIGSGEGGGRDEKGLIHERLQEALHDAAQQHDIDLVLVCKDRRAYSAAQRARGRLLQAARIGDDTSLWKLPPDRRVVGDRLAERARARELVLFMGAGVSVDAGILAWQELLNHVVENSELRLDLQSLNKLDFRDQATVIQRRLGDTSIGEAIRDVIAAPRYTLLHGLLASLPTDKAVTTNFDTLFEEAVGATGDTLAVLPSTVPDRFDRWLLKLHGSIDDAESVVLTRAHYLDMSLRRGALLGLVQAMLLTQHLLFVGYSLSDEDFHELVNGVRIAAEGRAGPEGSARKFGTVLRLGKAPFFEELWNEDLDVVDLPDPEGGGGRDLAILLDYIGHKAADADAFLLDSTYAGMFDETEERLAVILGNAQTELQALGGELQTHPAARRILQLLDQLGHEATTSEHDAPD